MFNKSFNNIAIILNFKGTNSKNIKNNLFYNLIDIQNKISKETEDSISYDLFRIGSQSEQSELMKNVIKEYKILVRTKTHGFEVCYVIFNTLLTY